MKSKVKCRSVKIQAVAILYHGEYFSVAIEQEAFWAAVPVWKREISLTVVGKWASIPQC